MFQVALMKFKELSDGRGNLTAIEGGADIPFDIKRVYYITRVQEDVVRGMHSHIKLHQVLICLNGSVKVKVFNGEEYEIHTLDRADIGLYIGPAVWREMHDFSEQSVLMVLASEYYDEKDYIRDYNEYLKQAKIYFD